MTNTKFRKRALLSSVAMLLVALVALGSATFAWFTDDPKADATGISVTANTGLGLLASTTTDSTPSHHAKLYNKSGWAAFVLTPATTIDASAFYTTKANAENASALKAGETWGTTSPYTVASGDTGPGSGVYHEAIYLETTAGSANADIYLKKITMTSTSTHAMKDAVVVGVKYGSTYEEYNLNGTKITKWTAAQFAAATAASSTKVDPTGKSGDSLNKKLFSNIASGSANKQTVDVFIYLDGANDTVYTNNSAGLDTLFSSIKLEFEAENHTGS